MNIIFMGTPHFAVPTLEMLIKEKYHISAVVSQPDKPKGRGNKETMSPIKEVALLHNLPILQPERVKGDEIFCKHIQSLNPDLIIVVAFGQILPQSILDIPKYGCINIHGSLLPKYRGAAPIQWSIINGDALTGVTIMYMDVGMDTGDMLVKKEIPITKEDTYESLHDKMKIVGADTLKEVIPMLIKGTLPRQKQDDTQSTYAPMISKLLGEIDWNKSNEVIDALVRGLNPWPTGYTYYKGETMKIWKAMPIEQATPMEQAGPMALHSELRPGSIIEVDKKGIVVQTGKGSILIEEIQMPNKKRMPVSEYIKGNAIDAGTMLGI